MDRNDSPRTPRPSNASDQEIAAEAAALGVAGISQSTGTGGPGSGLVAGTHPGPGRTSHAATTGETTNSSDDLADAHGPSGVQFGGTGEAGSGLGAPSTPVSPRGSDATASGTAGLSGAPGAAGDKGSTSGGSAAGGGGGGAGRGR